MHTYIQHVSTSGDTLASDETCNVKMVADILQTVSWFSKFGKLGTCDTFCCGCRKKRPVSDRVPKGLPFTEK